MSPLFGDTYELTPINQKTSSPKRELLNNTQSTPPHFYMIDNNGKTHEKNTTNKIPHRR